MKTIIRTHLSRIAIAAALLGASSTAIGSGAPAPRPEGTRLSGPAIVGTMTMNPAQQNCGGQVAGCDYADVSFVGRCGSQTIAVNFMNVDLSGTYNQVSDESLTGWYNGDLGNALIPLGCNSAPPQTPAVVINTVTSFDASAFPQIVANVVWLWVQNK